MLEGRVTVQKHINRCRMAVVLALTGTMLSACGTPIGIAAGMAPLVASAAREPADVAIDRWSRMSCSQLRQEYASAKNNPLNLVGSGSARLAGLREMMRQKGCRFEA